MVVAIHRGGVMFSHLITPSRGAPTEDFEVLELLEVIGKGGGGLVYRSRWAALERTTGSSTQ